MSQTPDSGTPDSGTPDPSTPPPIEYPTAIRGEYRRRSYNDPQEDETRVEEDDEDGRPSRLEPDELGQEEATPLSPDEPDSEAAWEPIEPGVRPDREYAAQVTARERERQSGEAAVSSNMRQSDYPQPGEGAVKIGLWGSPQSGKTTYLAALRHATGAGDTGCGSWNIYPRNDTSRDLLVRFTHTLVHERRFPEATPLGATVPLEWLFVGDIAKSKFDRRRLRRRGRVESRFLLDLIDVTGGAFAHDPEKAGVAAEVASAALKHLIDARGLIYLFDPLGEKVNKDSDTYMNRTIAELQQHAALNGQAGFHLPHYVSVCVSKFDHPEIFQQARRMGLVNYGDDGMPRVRDEHAEQFFDALCEGGFWSEQDEQSQASAQFVRDQLRTVFDPSHIRYFVTSSIGFWRPPGWDPSSSRFNPDDFANYLIKDGLPSIKGAINPINVLEPLISLQQWASGQV